MAQAALPGNTPFRQFIIRHWPWLLYGLATLIIAIQRFVLNDINNFAMFEYSFPHLLEGKNLYVWYPDEYNDNYKYGPIFALFMAPFWYLPPFLDLFVWMALNGALFLYAVNRLPLLDQRQKNMMLLFCLVEYTTATHNGQANPAVTAMFIGTFLLMEQGKPFWAAALVSLGGFVKLYLLLGGAFFLLYPGKGRFLLGMVAWSVVWLLLPLLVTSPENLIFQYREWYTALVDKVAIHHSVSVIGLIQHLLGIPVKPMHVTAAGVGLFLLVYIRIGRYRRLGDRMLFLALVLLWSVLFSPGSESPTYIIAVTGVAIWYQLSRRGWPEMVLAGLVLVFTSLGVTDLFPKSFINTYILGYCLKALPCLLVFSLIWVWLVFWPESAPAKEKLS